MYSLLDFGTKLNYMMFFIEYKQKNGYLFL